MTFCSVAIGQGVYTFVMRQKLLAPARETFRSRATLTATDRAWGGICGGIVFFLVAIVTLALLRVQAIASFAPAAFIASMLVGGIVLGIRFPNVLKAICSLLLDFG